MFIGWTMGVTILACAVSQIDPNGIGSGIPEMKSLLTGPFLFLKKDPPFSRSL